MKKKNNFNINNCVKNKYFTCILWRFIAKFFFQKFTIFSEKLPLLAIYNYAYGGLWAYATSCCIGTLFVEGGALAIFLSRKNLSITGKPIWPWIFCNSKYLITRAETAKESKTDCEKKNFNNGLEIVTGKTNCTISFVNLSPFLKELKQHARDSNKAH